MIHWGWLVAALFVGAFFGIFVLACCVAAKNGDRQLNNVEWPEYPR